MTKRVPGSDRSLADRRRSCTCPECVEACHLSPGWFLPGEAELAAARLGMAFEEFRRRYLITDYWAGRRSETEVLAPIKTGPAIDQANKYREDLGLSPDVPGGRASWGYAFTRGRCVFLGEDNRCRIHAAKPHECRKAVCCEPSDKGTKPLRRWIASQWARAARAMGVGA